MATGASESSAPVRTTIARPDLTTLAEASVDCVTVSTDEIDEYLRGVDEQKRSTLQALRRTILEIVPDADQVLSYSVPAFRVGGKTVAGFAAFKNHLSYLPFSGSVLTELADELKDYTMTKSALHFPVDRPLAKSVVQKLVAVRLAEDREGPRQLPTQRLPPLYN